MFKTFKAQYHEGAFRPLEPVELSEGVEAEVRVATPPSTETSGGSKTRRGGFIGLWQDLIEDEEALLGEIYTSRELPGRAVEL